MTEPSSAPEMTAQITEDRRKVIRASLDGDLQSVIDALAHQSPYVRASALVGLARNQQLSPVHIGNAAADTDPVVRRQLAQLAAAPHNIDLLPLLRDPDDRVTEMAAWAAGEREQVTPDELQTIHDITAEHDDALCREAAVAALGAIGQDQSLPVILAATKDKATVRRRAILALAPHDTPEVTAALELALQDRDWQVRQAAEDLLGTTDPDALPADD